MTFRKRIIIATGSVLLLVLCFITLWLLHEDTVQYKNEQASLQDESIQVEVTLNSFLHPLRKLVFDPSYGRTEIDSGMAQALCRCEDSLLAWIPEDGSYPVAGTFLRLTAQFGQLFSSAETYADLEMGVLPAAMEAERILYSYSKAGYFTDFACFTPEELLISIENNSEVNAFVDQYAPGGPEAFHWPRE